MKRLLAVAALAVLAWGCAPSDPRTRAETDWADCEVWPDVMRQLDACTGVIENPISDDARRTTAFINRAMIRSGLGQHARAIADLGRASRLSPDNARIHIERGQIHRLRGAYEDALRAVEAALEVEPQMPMALQLRQDLIAEQQAEGQSQIARISEALLVDPRNPSLLNERCWLRAVRGEDLELALADCNAALAIEPDLAAALDSRGLVYLKSGAASAALADYEAALKVEPSRGHFLYGRGLARIALGRKSEGEADLTAAEQAEPGVGALYRSYGVGL